MGIQHSGFALFDGFLALPWLPMYCRNTSVVGLLHGLIANKRVFPVCWTSPFPIIYLSISWLPSGLIEFCGNFLCAHRGVAGF